MADAVNVSLAAKARKIAGSMKVVKAKKTSGNHRATNNKATVDAGATALAPIVRRSISDAAKATRADMGQATTKAASPGMAANLVNVVMARVKATSGKAALAAKASLNPVAVVMGQAMAARVVLASAVMAKVRAISGKAALAARGNSNPAAMARVGNKAVTATTLNRLSVNRAAIAPPVCAAARASMDRVTVRGITVGNSRDTGKVVLVKVKLVLARVVKGLTKAVSAEVRPVQASSKAGKAQARINDVIPAREQRDTNDPTSASLRTLMTACPTAPLMPLTLRLLFKTER